MEFTEHQNVEKGKIELPQKSSGTPQKRVLEGIRNIVVGKFTEKRPPASENSKKIAQEYKSVEI